MISAQAALAFAARGRGIPCTIVVPETAPKAKVDRIKDLGADVIVCEHAQREATVGAFAEATGATMIHPFDNDLVIAGQSTLGTEIIEQVPDVDAILVPVSGGGMAAGVALATKFFKPNAKVILVEPKGKNLADSIRHGHRDDSQRPLATIADGMRSRALGERPFNILRDFVSPDAVLSVDDDAILSAMTTLFADFKACVEPSGATALAAIQSTPPDVFRRATGDHAETIAAIVCGGNLDIGPILRSAFPVSSPR